MDEEKLLDQIDFAQARIEETEGIVLNADPNGRAYKVLIEGYNKWVDRYDELIDILQEKKKAEEQETLERERIALEREKLQVEKSKIEAMNKIEEAKIELEKSKMETMQEIEQDKVNLDTERLRLDREKFAHEVQQATRTEVIDVIFKSADIGVKVLVPVLYLAGAISLSKFSYMSDEELKLCNGHIFVGPKELIRMLTNKN